MASPQQLYSYPSTNAQLVEDLKLQKHPEGGYYVETGRWEEPIPSPFANGEDRPLATIIYYLLTADEPRGVFHRNRSNTMHVLHQGRATYTLIYPPTTPSSPPTIKRVTMGTDITAGETRQLFVGTNCWKRSEIPEHDLRTGNKETTGCLITEVVAPGFVWQDHDFLTIEGLNELFSGAEGGDAAIAEYKEYLRKA